MPATPAGYAVQRYEDRRVDLVARWQTAYGPNANTASDTVDGLLIDIICRMAQYADEQGFSAYSSHFFHTAKGLNLDLILAGLFGTKRRQDRGSVAEVTMFGAPGTPIFEGALVSTSDRGDVFRLLSTTTIETKSRAVFVYSASAALTTTSLKVNGVEYSPLAPISGTGVEVAEHAKSIMTIPDGNWETVFDVFEDVNGNGVVIVDMTAPWAIEANSSQAESAAWYGVSALVESEDVGAINGEALTITRINTPVGGWEGVVNLEPATLGGLEDTDAEYRVQHLLKLGQPAYATPMGLQAQLYALKGVEIVRPYFNFTGENPDAFGRPSHSWEYVVEGGSVEDIAKTGWLSHTTGTQSWGNITTIIIDSRDNSPRVIRFSRPTKRYVWIDVDITPGEGFPTTPVRDIELAVTQSLLAYGQGLGIGSDAYIDTIKQQVGIPGVRSIAVRMGTTFSPLDPKPPVSAVDLTVAELDLTRWAETRIKVVVL